VADHPSQWNENYHALIIGNANYRHWRPLRGVMNDVHALQEALEANQVETTLKLDLTRAQMEEALIDFVFSRGMDPRNKLIVYVAGHGYTEALIDGGRWGGIVGVESPDPRKDLAGYRRSSVPMKQLEDLLLKAKSRQALVLLDTCFSGALFEGAAPPVPPASDEERRHRERLPTRQFITSGSAGDQVPDFSQFNAAILGLLTGTIREPQWDGYLTGAEIGRYVASTLSGQRPQYGTIKDPRYADGDFVLRLDPRFSPAPMDRPVAVRFVSNISGVTVYLDGRELGKADARRPLDVHVLPGQYMLRAAKHFSTVPSIERVEHIANSWTGQTIALRFPVQVAPPP